MAQKWRIISQDAFCRTVAGSLATTGVRANYLHKIGIGASVNAIRFLWWLGGINWTAGVGFATDMDVQFGMRGYSGSTPNGSGWEQVGLTSYLKDTGVVSTAHSLSLSAGDTLQLSLHARAMTGGMNVMGTRKLSTSEGGETGDSSLAAKTNGESLTAGNNGYGFAPGAVLGLTNTPSLFLIGHSVPTGTGVATNQFYGVVAARQASYGCTIYGLDGSNPASMTTGAPWDLAQYCDVAIIHWAINSINSWADANPLAPATDVIGNIRDAMRTTVRRLKQHVRHVILATEWFTDAGGTYGTERKAARAAWNEYVRGNTTYSGTSCAAYIGNDDYWDLAAIGENQPNLHTAKSGFTVTLHPADAEQALIGASLGTEIASGGRLYTYFSQAVAADTGYIALGPQEGFWGPALAAGTAPTGWGYWKLNGAPAGNSLNIDGTGGISAKASAGTWDQCMVYNTSVPNTGIIEATTADIPTQNAGASPPQLHFWSMGFTPSTAVTGAAGEGGGGSQRPRYGYQLLIKNTGIEFYRRPASVGGTSLWSTTHTALVAGDRLRVKITRSLSGANRTFLIQVYLNGSSTPLHNQLVTDTAVPVGWEDGLYPYVGTTGSTASEFPAGKVWDSFSAYEYNPVTIDQVVPSVATMELVPGDRRSFSALVQDDQGDPATGQIVTAALSGITSGAVGGSATTGVDGVAQFTDTGGVYAPSTTTPGTTGTLTLTCAGVTGVITINVVSAYTMGGGGGDGDMIETDDTEVVATTGSWSAGIDGPVSIDLQPLEGDLFYQVGTEAPAAGVKGKFVRSSNTKAVRVATGKTIYWRSKEAAGTLAYDIKNS